MDGKDENARMQIARRVGGHIALGHLPDAERLAAEALARELVNDAIGCVRQELSKAVRHAKYLPRDIALKIAHDIDSVACPFLEVTEVFSDAEWQQLVLTISRGARIAVARRTSMTEGLALALAELGDSVVAERLVENLAAPMTSTVCDALIGRFETSTWVLDKLAEREGLVEQIAVKLFVKISAASREMLSQTYGSPDYIEPIGVEAEFGVGQASHDLPVLTYTPGTKGPGENPYRPAETPADNPIATLTRREMQVLSLLTQGLANKQIAYELNIQEATVKVYVGRLLRKFHARNRTQVATKAINLGWQN